MSRVFTRAPYTPYTPPTPFHPPHAVPTHPVAVKVHWQQTPANGHVMIWYHTKSEHIAVYYSIIGGGEEEILGSISEEKQAGCSDRLANQKCFQKGKPILLLFVSVHFSRWWYNWRRCVFCGKITLVHTLRVTHTHAKITNPDHAYTLWLEHQHPIKSSETSGYLPEKTNHLSTEDKVISLYERVCVPAKFNLILYDQFVHLFISTWSSNSSFCTPSKHLKTCI